MFSPPGPSQAADQPRFLQSDAPLFMPGEVVITTVKQARNDGLPHARSVAGGAVPAVESFGEPTIDNILLRAGAAPVSIERVFTPQTESERGAAADAPPDAAQAIPAGYSDEEDQFGFSRTYRVRYERDVDIAKLSEQLQQSDAVEEARPNYIHRTFRRPNDRFYGYQWGPRAINCESAWDVETGHPDVKIAIVDSGVDLGHRDLTSKLAAGYDTVNVPQWGFGWRFQLVGDHLRRDRSPADEDGHGTHCAGIAAAQSDNGDGVAGVCWGGQILPIRVMARAWDHWKREYTSLGSSVDIGEGIKMAIDLGADVINLSLGGGGNGYNAVLDYAYHRNVCVVAATGNENTTQASYPAAHPRVLAVGAIDSNDNRAWFSNHGPNYNRFVMAPGVDIASTYRGNSYVYLPGTSMATPFVAGVAGLLVSAARRAGRSLTAEQVYEAIRSTARNLGNSYFYGEGLVDAAAALQAV